MLGLRPWSVGTAPQWIRPLHRNYFSLAQRIPRTPKVRPLQPRKNDIRKATTEAGEDNTGHITARPNEGILFFDNLFPLKIHFLLRRLPWQIDRDLPALLRRFNNSTLNSFDAITLVKRAIPESIPIKVTEIVPRLKDGGAFVRFAHPEGISSEEVEQLLEENLRRHKLRPWYNPLALVGTGLVRGTPWIEDLWRFPSSRLKVEFVPTSPGNEAAELSQEVLYGLFRRYGKLAEITSQPSDSKVLPKYAILDFGRIRCAIMARNCMHGFRVMEDAGGGKAGTELRLAYEQRMKAHVFRDWLRDHPRIVLPIIAALVAAITVAIFDPIRTFFIRTHVEHSFDVKGSRLYKWFKSQATDIFTFRRRASEDTNLSAIWDDRKAAIEKIQTWMMETADTFVVIQGPRGSGKKELILDQALKGRPNVLVIDCKPIQEARGDAATINAAAAEVGYKPVFSWMNSFSSLIDLAAQGTIGIKSGFSETLDTQLAKIWQNTATALRQIGVSGRKKTDADFALADDDYLEAHPEKRPVVVIDNFSSSSSRSENDATNLVYDKVAEWAAGLTTANVAHVIFLTDDIAYSKSLGKALPNSIFRQISLGDITPQVAKRFVITHLTPDDGTVSGDTKLTAAQREQDLRELDECIEVLGGRLTDLEFFARRLRTGQTPRKAVEEIIEQSASEVLKMYLIAGSQANGSKKWSPEQAWFLIKALAENQQLRYNEVLLSNTFSGSLTATAASGEAVLEALSQAELISITTSKGRPEAIKVGRPVYQAAFKLLNADHVLKARLDLAILSELSKIETKGIDKYETELGLLAALPRQPREVAPRVQYLLEKLAASQQKVEGWEREMGAMKKVLMVEY